MSEKKEYLNFGGCDFSSAPWEVEDNRAVDMLNLISSEGGFPEKRMGTVLDATYPDEIYGLYRFHTATADELLVHSGTNLYRHGETPTVLYSQMAENKSEAKQLGDLLIFADKTALRCYDGTTVADLKDSAYEPMIRIDYAENESDNLLSLYVWEEADGSSNNPVRTKYAPIADGVLYTYSQTKNKWVPEINVTVDSTRGTFSPPYVTDKKCRVRYRKTSASALTEQQEIAKASVLDVFGGKLYVAGSQSHSIDYRSAVNQPTYFPANQAQPVGGSGTAIVGYLHLSGGRQAILKESDGTLPSLYLRDETEGLKEALSGFGALAGNTQGYVNSEGLFLSDVGVMAVSSSTVNISNPVYANCRSRRINARLLKENLTSACATTFHGYYILSVGEHYYVADGRKKEEKEYEWYYWQAPAATHFCATPDTLYFASPGGKLCHFVEGLYSDFGEDFDAYWVTPPTALNNYFKKKSIVGGLCLPKPEQGGRVSVDYLVKDCVYRALSDSSTGWLDFATLDFSNFTFETDRTPRGIPLGKLRNFYSLQLRIRAHKGRPFGLYGLVLHYVCGQTYRG